MYIEYGFGVDAFINKEFSLRNIKLLNEGGRWGGRAEIN